MASRSNGPTQHSAFKDSSLKSVTAELMDEVRRLYLEDSSPWVIGYSGGKDSTATLQLIWHALKELEESKRTKPVHVISTDTLVENPVVAAWVTRSLATMRKAAEEQGLPIQAHKLTPQLEDTFWVNLIGRGYPSPRHKFRWCTDRLKIKPSNRFINEVVRSSGEAILVLGTRKAESTRRKHAMEKLEAGRVRDRLSPNAKLPGSLVYTPVEDWSNDDVWMYLMQVKNPWGYSNKELLRIYSGASPDNECPLVVDTSTPSCGDSRFGCWVCTMVTQDKSMTAMIHNDRQKEWMQPLLDLRDRLEVKDDRSKRDFRRLSGAVQLFHDRPIKGPYKQEVRKEWLEEVLWAQEAVRDKAPRGFKDIELISMPELEEIRRIWVVEKHEVEDILPDVYEEVVGEPYPGKRVDDALPFGKQELALLKEACGDAELLYELTRNLLDVERQHQAMTKRVGLFKAIEDTIRRAFYEGEEDATERALKRRDRMRDVQERVDATLDRARDRPYAPANSDHPSLFGEKEDVDAVADVVE